MIVSLAAYSEAVYIIYLYLHLHLQGSSLTLVLMVASAAFGGTLQYGYNLAIMNSPTTVSMFLCVCSHVFM